MTEKMLNGIDIAKVNEAVEAIKANPGLAKFKLRISNKWIEGGHNRTTVGDFYGVGQENSHSTKFELDADEPKVLAGSDLAPSPVEYLLNALAAFRRSFIMRRYAE